MTASPSTNPLAGQSLSTFLQGKVAIVTGGNSGIGKAIVENLAELGAKVVIDYRSHPEATEELEREIGSYGGSSYGVHADVSNLDDLQRLVQEAVAKYGRLDVMVNNAGVETRTSILNTTPDDFDKVLDVNLRGVFFACQYAAKQMIAQGGGGRIINISSVHEDWPMPENTPYCCAKGGVRMLTRTAGLELASHGPRRCGHTDQRLHHEQPGVAGQTQRRHSPRPHGPARGDRQGGGLPGQRRC